MSPGDTSTVGAIMARATHTLGGTGLAAPAASTSQLASTATEGGSGLLDRARFFAQSALNEIRFGVSAAESTTRWIAIGLIALAVIALLLVGAYVASPVIAALK